jgi:predicted phage-related endonuclease
MSFQDSGAKRRAEKFRKSRQAKGETQMQIWLDESLKAKLDEFVKSGRFRNRSELVAVAVNNWIEGLR